MGSRITLLIAFIISLLLLVIFHEKIFIVSALSITEIGRLFQDPINLIIFGVIALLVFRSLIASSMG